MQEKNVHMVDKSLFMKRDLTKFCQNVLHLSLNITAEIVICDICIRISLKPWETADAFYFEIYLPEART